MLFAYNLFKFNIFIFIKQIENSYTFQSRRSQTKSFTHTCKTLINLKLYTNSNNKKSITLARIELVLHNAVKIICCDSM